MIAGFLQVSSLCPISPAACLFLMFKYVNKTHSLQLLKDASVRSMYTHTTSFYNAAYFYTEHFKNKSFLPYQQTNTILIWLNSCCLIIFHIQAPTLSVWWLWSQFCNTIKLLLFKKKLVHTFLYLTSQLSLFIVKHTSTQTLKENVFHLY